MRPEEAIDRVRYMQQLLEETRVRVADSYPHFLWWGLVWTTGYLTNLWVTWTWFVAAPIGMVGSAVIGASMGRGAPPVSPLLRRLAWVNIVLFVSVAALPAVVTAGLPVRLEQPCCSGFVAYYPLVMGVIYLVNGIFLGCELVAIGGWLVFAALASLALPMRVALVWMAVAGGGSLLLTGVLLRREARSKARPRHLKVA